MGRLPGITQWFRFEHREEVQSTRDVLRELEIRELRTALSWADWERPGGPEWFDWVIDYLYEARIEIIPALFYTPMARAYRFPNESPEDVRTSFPPARPEDYANFCETMIWRYGRKLSNWYMLWNEPNNDAYYSPRHDPQHEQFAVMAHCAIDRFQKFGKQTVLGGIIPPYPPFLETMKHYGVLARVNALGIHAFPGTWNKMDWRGWEYALAIVRNKLRSDQEVWITETGYSTITLEDGSPEVKRQREYEQIGCFDEARNSSADRVFWYSAIDQQPDHLTDNAICRGTACDPRAYHFGLVGCDDRPKPLHRHWESLVLGEKLRRHHETILLEDAA